jgi:hypothetical protein
MTILELSGFFVAIERVCSRLFTAYRGNIWDVTVCSTQADRGRRLSA